MANVPLLQIAVVAQNTEAVVKVPAMWGYAERELLVLIMTVVGPIIVALVYISLCSLFKEPNRQNFNAIMMAGAGAA